jgi:serine/threonine protein kinase
VNALEQEIYLLSRLQHSNIVRYLGMEKTNDSINIFLEYVSGTVSTQIVAARWFSVVSVGQVREVP